VIYLILHLVCCFLAYGIMFDRFQDYTVLKKNLTKQYKSDRNLSLILSLLGIISLFVVLGVAIDEKYIGFKLW